MSDYAREILEYAQAHPMASVGWAIVFLLYLNLMTSDPRSY